VTFAGSVAGTRYVVVELPSGWLLTYGKLSASAVRKGQSVVAGTALGDATGEFYFGLRIAGQYRDPEPYLGRLAGRPRLVPTDGRVPRPAPPRLVCR
jgi:murein DD-endopeptidase MepM/ murein hydrolase activator NlpD